jgi:hypothetical protein
MNNRTLLVSALALALSAASTFAAPLKPVTQQVHIDDSKLDAANGWDEVSPGVYQRIDAADGTVSIVSVGEAGRRHDLGVAKQRLALVRQKLENAMQRGHRTQNLVDEIVELENTVERLAPKSEDSLSKGTVLFYDWSAMCHNVKGDFSAEFNTYPRSGGGTVGTVTSIMNTALCMAFECNQNEDAYATGYNGGTYSYARASNSGGQVTSSQYSNGGTIVNMYTLPGSLATVGTPNVNDSACELRATGYINTTLATTPYQSCHLYKNFSVTKTCAQVP